MHRVLVLGSLVALFVVAASADLPLQAVRHSPQDLKLSGMFPGKEQAVRYVRYSDLGKLPQTRFIVTGDSNFSAAASVSGVSLKDLLRALGENNSNILVAAICDDQYEAHYTAEYRQEHDPVLVLSIDGKQPAAWPRTGDGGTYGPYLISHRDFHPAFYVLAHTDEPQIPNGVLELRFLDQKTVLDAIRPHGTFAADSPQMQGYEIAFQNCFRCHNHGDYGGHKAGWSWGSLAGIAAFDPNGFRAYVQDPQQQEASAKMPPNPEYDAATLDALTAYFQTFAAQE